MEKKPKIRIKMTMGLALQMLVAFSVKFQQSHLLSRFLVTIYSQRVHAEGLNFSPILKSKSVSLLQSDYKKCRVNCPDTPPLQITTMSDSLI